MYEVFIFVFCVFDMVNGMTFDIGDKKALIQFLANATITNGSKCVLDWKNPYFNEDRYFFFDNAKNFVDMIALKNEVYAYILEKDFGIVHNHSKKMGRKSHNSTRVRKYKHRGQMLVLNSKLKTEAKEYGFELKPLGNIRKRNLDLAVGVNFKTSKVSCCWKDRSNASRQYNVRGRGRDCHTFRHYTFGEGFDNPS